MATGLVFNVQRYSIDDGPGIRTTVFLKGCPLTCPWCHNPEGVSPLPEVLIVADRCVECVECVRVCPAPPVVGPQGRMILDRRECLGCGRCVEVCVAGARHMVGVERTADDLLLEVERDRVFYERTGGGATFSGGEPLAQGDFLIECLQGCRERGLHAAVDTSGFAERDLILTVAGLADLILFDLKTLDPEQHQKLTGVPLAPIIGNLRAVDASGVHVVVRFPMIPGITDSDANVEAVVDVMTSLTNSRSIQLLPFHRTAVDKYRRLGRVWQYGALEPLPANRTSAVADFLTSRGLLVQRRGAR